MEITTLASLQHSIPLERRIVRVGFFFLITLFTLIKIIVDKEC